MKYSFNYFIQAFDLPASRPSGAEECRKRKIRVHYAVFEPSVFLATSKQFRMACGLTLLQVVEMLKLLAKCKEGVLP